MKENNIQPPHLKLVAELINSLSAYSAQSLTRVTGQAIIEHPKPSKKQPMVVMYFCNEDGQYMVWFADEMKFHLYARIEGVTRRICSALIQNVDDVQKEIDKLRPILEKKKPEERDD